MIVNALLGFPHSDRVAKRSTRELWDRQDARQVLYYGCSPGPAYTAGYRLMAYLPEFGAEYWQVSFALSYLRGEQC
jgi:hypothetical protein